MNSIAALTIDGSWSLFLDRDGVINQKLDNDYVKSIEEFTFIQGAPKAIQNFRSIFGRLLVVTNQQGIGKGIMTHEELHHVHNHMEKQLQQFDVKFDALYYCPELAEDNAPCRKPNIGMALQAKQDFPEIDFSKSILIGDSITDIQMGKRAGMKTVFIHSELANPQKADLVVKSLEEFSMMLENS
ncbi:HAD family hydrolase [Vicingaceae bacterium]|nr:HAD family hydrolase [Vicingaceae bacterium]MDC1452310.1 HAD family hydrolase [Vicingaceae bacterium]